MSHHLYRRGAIYWARIQIAGRDHRRSMRTASRADAQRRAEAWLKELQEQIRFGLEPTRIFDEAVTAFIEAGGNGIKPSALKRYRTSLKMAYPYFKGRPLAAIRNPEIRGFVQARQVAGATNATIRRDLTALSRVLAHAVHLDWIGSNPFTAYDRRYVRERRLPPQFVTDTDLARLLDRAPPDMRATIHFLELTGMRTSEAVNLEWQAVDLKAGTVQLFRTKTNRPRSVPLSPEAKKLLVRRGPSDRGFVFAKADGRPFGNFSSRFAQLAKSAGVHFRAHDLRHRFAILWVRRGGDIYDLSRVLGHSSVKTTEIYLGYAPATSLFPPV